MIERRLFPRYCVELRAEVWQPEGKVYQAIGTELGRGGVALDLDCAVVEGMACVGGKLNQGDRFRLRLHLGDVASGGMLSAECRAAYVRRLSQDRYAIGARFHHIEGGEARLEAFLSWCAESSGTRN